MYVWGCQGRGVQPALGPVAAVSFFAREIIADFTLWLHFMCVDTILFGSAT